MRASSIVTPAVLALLTACAGVGPVETKLEECELISAGEIGPRVTSAFYQPDGCYRECLASASCEELASALCGTSIELLRRCDERCAHHCPDGSLIALEAVCDGSMQCPDGSDEAGCPTFTCSSGMVLPATVRCNGSWDCVSGEDEAGCSGQCEATWGGPIQVEWYRCDGYENCTDGADERDCPEHRCADGMTIRHRPGITLRCDGWASCYDGSDEDGCAELTPMCPMP